MYAPSNDDKDCDDPFQDPLTRLVMDSDGVTEAAMNDVIRQLRQALAARAWQARSAYFIPTAVEASSIQAAGISR